MTTVAEHCTGVSCVAVPMLPLAEGDVEIFGLNLGPPAVAAAIVTAVAGILLAVLRAGALVVSGKRERQRDLYGKAYRAAMAWREMLYRVRRRGAGEDADRALIERFHELQEEIDYYQGWTASDGRWIGRSYCRLVEEIKRETRPLLQGAWAEQERRPAAAMARDEDGHPQTDEARDRFLKDVRNHLSLWVLPKFAVVWRNRKCFGGDK
jgi:hypothetical protein